VSAYNCRSHAQGNLKQSSGIYKGPFDESNNSSLSKSGAMALNVKFEGEGSTTKKFEGISSKDSN
jgi:hypothetical protein